MTSFKLKDGQTSSYGLDCGYVQRSNRFGGSVKDDDDACHHGILHCYFVDLYKEHNAYHVKSRKGKADTFEWLSFDTLKDARKYWRQKTREYNYMLVY